MGTADLCESCRQIDDSEDEGDGGVAGLHEVDGVHEDEMPRHDHQHQHARRPRRHRCTKQRNKLRLVHTGFPDFFIQVTFNPNYQVKFFRKKRILK